MLERSNIESSRFESAASYLKWGTELQEPVLGCIAILSRRGGGHIGFVVGHDGDENIALLGGNQNDAINISLFPRGRFLGYRWPEGVSDKKMPLPLVSGPRSLSEG